MVTVSPALSDRRESLQSLRFAQRLCEGAAAAPHVSEHPITPSLPPVKRPLSVAEAAAQAALDEEDRCAHPPMLEKHPSCKALCSTQFLSFGAELWICCGSKTSADHI